MGKTPEYTKKAIDNYREKFDFIQVRFPKGTRERIKEIGNVNQYIVDTVLASLEKHQNADTDALEEKTDNTKAEPEKPDIAALYEKYKGNLTEFVVQLEIQEKYGNEVLLQLSDYAKGKR